MATKRLMVFDLDGTLAESKSPVDDEMGVLLAALLRVVPVAIISGGDWPQFQKQVLARLPQEADLSRLVLLPTCGTKFYRYEGTWTKLYADDLTDEQRRRTFDALAAAIERSGFEPARTWGELIEDRGTQITYSALGQQAPLADKQVWDPDFAKRRVFKEIVQPMLPDLSIHLGGATSVDITKPGIDKAYGIHKLAEILGIAVPAMLFAGDALLAGGNDAPVRDAGVTSIQVRDPDECKRVIETFIACAG